MKRTLLFLLIQFICMVFSASAQEKAYEPLLEDGKMWVYEHHYVDINFNFLTCESRDWIDGDTVIDGRSLYRMYSVDYYEEDARPSVSYWYEEGGKVYQYIQGRSILTYDFTLSKGDDLPPALFYDCEIPYGSVLDIDTVCVRGHYRKRMSLSFFNVSLRWVEGVGSPERVTEPLGHLTSDGKKYYLQSCYLGDSLVFGKEDFDAPPYTGLVRSQVLPMLGEKTAWRYFFQDYKPGAPRGTWLAQTYYELLEGDSVVDGTSYRRMVVSDCVFGANSYHWDDGDSPSCSNGYMYEEMPDSPHFIVLLREEGGKVYIQRKNYLDYLDEKISHVYGAGCHSAVYTEDGAVDQILYDFTLHVGDKYPMAGDVSVLSVDEVMTDDGVTRRLFTLSNDMQILEGMGCVNCSGRLIGYQSSDKDFTWSGDLYYLGSGEWYYPHGVDEPGVSFEWTPSSVKGQPYRGECASSAMPCFDLLGRRLASPPLHGVYIRGGRKYVR